MFNNGMNSNQFMQMIQGMMQQGGKNPQAFVDKLLKDNPQFAKQIEGQNVQQMAMQAMKQRGIDPAQLMQMFGGGRR